MSTFLKVIFIIGILHHRVAMAGPSLFSANGEGTHFLEHFTASALIYTGTYLFAHDVLGGTKTGSFIFSASFTLLIGFTYKMLEGMQQGYMPHNTGKSMIYNGVGIAVPGIVLYRF